jgi:hypothetical protein
VGVGGGCQRPVKRATGGQQAGANEAVRRRAQIFLKLTPLLQIIALIGDCFGRREFKEKGERLTERLVGRNSVRRRRAKDSKCRLAPR